MCGMVWCDVYAPTLSVLALRACWAWLATARLTAELAARRVRLAAMVVVEAKAEGACG